MKDCKLLLVLLCLSACSGEVKEKAKLTYNDFEDLFDELRIDPDVDPKLIIVTPATIGCSSCIDQTMAFIEKQADQKTILSIIIGARSEGKLEISIIYHMNGNQIADVMRVEKIDSRFAVIQPRYYFIKGNKITEELIMYPSNYASVLESAENMIE